MNDKFVRSWISSWCEINIFGEIHTKKESSPTPSMKPMRLVVISEKSRVPLLFDDGSWLSHALESTELTTKNCYHKVAMKTTAFLVIILQICSVIGDSCEKCHETSKAAVDSRVFLTSNSIIYELTNIVPRVDFVVESDRCKGDLLAIKEGIRKKSLWTFKRKFPPNDSDKLTSK